MRQTAILVMIFFLIKNCNNFQHNLFINKTDKTSLVLGEKIAELLRLYENYNRLFYIDAESLELYESARSFFIFNKRKQSIYVYNFQRPKKFPPRPKIANIVHVVLAKNITTWDFLNHQKNVNYRDVVLFVAENTNLKGVLIKRQKHTIRLAGKTLLLEAENFEIKLFKICFYCGELQNYLQEISLRGLNGKSAEIFPDDYKNLNGHQLNLAFIPNYPFAYCNQSEMLNSKKVCEEINGIESHMIKLISRKMNFSFILYEMEANKSSYLNMLKNMHSHDTDIAFGAISMTLNRRNVIEFTTQYHAEDYHLLYKTSLSFLDVLEKFFDPFSSPILWVLFLLAYVLVAFVLYLMQLMKKEERTSLKTCFWILLQIQLEQAVSGDSFKTSSKRNPCWGVLLLLWCACCMVLCAAYKGATLSSFVSPPRSEPESLAELVSAGYRIVANNQSFDIIQDSLNISDPVYRQTMKRMGYGTTSCEVFAEVLSTETHTALLNEWSMIQFQIRNQCQQPSKKVLRQIRVARQPVMNAGHAWATRLGAPFKQAIDHYLGLILSGGLFEKWRRDHTFEHSGRRVKKFQLSRDLRNKEIETITLTLQTFYPLFLIYSIGICCATISLIYEVIRFNFKKIKNEFVNI